MFKPGTRREAFIALAVLLALASSLAGFTAVWGSPDKFDIRLCQLAAVALSEAGVVFPADPAFENKPTWVIYRELMPLYWQHDRLGWLNLWTMLSATGVSFAAFWLCRRPAALSLLCLGLAAFAGYAWIEHFELLHKGNEPMLAECVDMANHRLQSLGADYSALDDPILDSLVIATDVLRQKFAERSEFGLWSAALVTLGSLIAGLVYGAVALIHLRAALRGKPDPKPS